MPDSSKLDLLCQLPHTANLQQLCDLVFQIMGNPIFISDMAHTILAYTKCVEIDDPTWQEDIVAAHLDSNTLKQNREVGSVHITSTAVQRPVLVQDDYIPYARIIKTLTRHNQAVGVVVLTSFLQPLGDQDPELLDLISAFILPKLIQERFHLTSDNRSVENYFIKLLDEEQPSREKIDRHLDSLGFQTKPYTYVVALCLSDAPGQTPSGTKNLEQIQQEFAQALHCPVLIYNALLLCIYGSDTPVHRWPEDVAGMAELLRRWSLLAGISRTLKHPVNLRDRYLQAQAVLDKGRKLGRQHNCFQFDTLSSFLLFDRIPPADLDTYCHEQILNLLEYDMAHDTQLCITLQTYLEQAKSLSKTADLLFIHRNTVRYRINRCMELMNDRLEDGNEIFAYILSLRTLEYRAKIHPMLPQEFFSEQNR